MESFMFFIGLLSFITLSIAGAAAFFSVYGLAYTFKSAFYAVIFMGVALEAGKLVTASFLYRYWKKITWSMKTYLCAAVFILMIITSVGIFAFLSKGYQENTSSLKELDIKISHLKNEETQLLARKAQISENKNTTVESVANITDKTKWWLANTKSQLAKSVASEDKELNQKLQTLSAELHALEEQKLNTELHVGPIIYIAQALGAEVDDATKYIILLLIIVFDPLAVVLTVGVNVAISQYKLDKKEKDDEINLNISDLQTNVGLTEDDILAKYNLDYVSQLVNRQQIIDNIRRSN